MPLRLRPVVFVLALGTGLGLAGCVPYAVGSTAATASAGQAVPDATFQYASHQRLRTREPGERPGDGPTVSLDNGARLGLDAYSDVGLRLVGLSGVVVTYGRRLSGPTGGDAGTKAIVGGGVLGGGSHYHLEGTIVASAGGASRITPYGGVRAQYLGAFAPDAIAAEAVGVFVGGRFGWPDLGIWPEVGVFYSPSDVFGQGDVVVAPSVTVRGDRLLRTLGL